MIEFLAGAVALAYCIAGIYFLRFWRKTRDRLFLSFALAFWLFAVNQAVVSLLGVTDERSGYAYILRVVGFLLILYAIVQKNLITRREP
jgi:quinol-cytochrome oxidoreductase complex cytochrome b subunit